jgi:DNA-binding transcriptional MocR family regulator
MSCAPLSAYGERRYAAVEPLLVAKLRPSLVFLTSPAVPLGYCVSPDWVREMAQMHPRTLFLVDEAFAELGMYSIPGRSCVPLVRELPNVVVARTFSKGYGLAGLRVGCLLAHRDNIEVLRRFSVTQAVTDGACAGALAALSTPNHYRTWFREASEVRDGARGALALLVEHSRRRGGLLKGAHVGEAGGCMLLDAKSPSAAHHMVCVLRAAHRVLAHDASADILGAVRIGLPRLTDLPRLMLAISDLP